ncbi:MAG TPA: VWA domain-containing protein [Methanofastidiosum sp.]|nr:VWA domain-containing protein [Methanofastidiosum sp.]
MSENKIRSLKIKDDLYFNAMAITFDEKKEKAIMVPDAQNQFLIFDRSGSMTGYLNKIMDSAIAYCNKLPEGSTVSLGYFSDTGQYNLTVPYTLKKELNGVTTTLNGYRRSLSMTNFIEILNKVNEIAGKVNGKSSLFFFTDGCHNSGGGRPQIEKALKSWTQYAQITMFVGYGYIDRDMMSWMASVTEGSFIHLNNFGNFEKTLEDFGVAVEDSSPSIPVDIPVSEEIIPVSFSGKALVEYVVEKGQIKFKPAKKEYRGIFFITKSKVKGAEDITEIDITLERGIRALATIHSQKNNILQALDLLSYIGDKYLIQNLYNSIAPEEFSEAETKIRRSIFVPKDRFLEGVVKDFLPDPNAFCVMDAINILIEDDNVKMYPRDKDFEYTSIGKKTEQTDGPSVEYPDDMFVFFNNVVMNKERLNLSISTEAKGTVNLLSDKFVVKPATKEDLTKMNIPEKFPVSSFRTYAIIADGKLQTKKLVISDISKETINKLGSILTRRTDGKYVVDFSSLPIINRVYVKMTSAKTLAEKVWQEKLLADQISVYTNLKKKEEEATGKVAVRDTGLSDEAAQYLIEHCYIKNGSYNPPTKLLAGDDEYEAYSFSIEPKGFTKVSASDVIKKVAAQKNTTPREQIVKEAYDQYLKDPIASLKGEALIKKLVEKITSLNKELKDVRKFIQLSKFAIILGNKGKMDEFSSRENMVLPMKVKSLVGTEISTTFEFAIDKVKVKI